jgi:hypothetical protein
MLVFAWLEGQRGIGMERSWRKPNKSILSDAYFFRLRGSVAPIIDDNRSNSNGIAITSVG